VLEDAIIPVIAGLAVGIAFLVIVSFMAAYQSDDQSEMDFNFESMKMNNATLDEFSLPTFIPTSIYAPEQVKVIQETVCGDPWMFDEIVPEQISFAYLQPKEPIYRIACSIQPAGLYFQHFYLLEDNTATRLGNAERLQLFSIDSSEKAMDYVVYFGLVRNGETGLVELVDNEDEYLKWAEQCMGTEKQQENNTITESPVRIPLVASFDGNQSYVVQANFVDMASGLLQYVKFVVTNEGMLELVQNRSLGHCGFAI
jgi:hypothetical protein